MLLLVPVYIIIKHDLARSCFQLKTLLCFMIYTPSYGNFQLKIQILEFTSKEAAASLMSMAAPVWFWKFWEKNSEFGNFFSKILKFWKFSKFWTKISKVGSKFWRWEGYICWKFSGTERFTKKFLVTEWLTWQGNDQT